ncbi:MAG: MFS transporter [Bacteroidaceae bacterium]|nr:MFS transporter [Bacteroidaceae bacterium]MBQ4056816.1 MFS transporter [Bacteroidaceae bacterium]
MKSKSIFPILFGFFVMGFVDVVGITTNYVQKDFQLPDSIANMLPMAVFLWFFVCSIPTAMMMNRIGKKHTVLVSMALTFIAMLIPMISYNYPMMLLAFALLGISNTILQAALNPLAATTVRKEMLTSILTWGQFIKAISSFLGPILAGAAAIYTGQWKQIFTIYATITLLSLVWTWMSVPNVKEEKQAIDIKATFSLFKDSFIFSLFVGIIMVVGIDVGLNTVIPKILIEKTGMALEQAGLGTSLYFVAKTAGTFIGALLLAKWSPKGIFRICMVIGLIALAGMIFGQQSILMYVLIVVVGIAYANVFSIIFSNALQYKPERNNDISALMVMGVSGGALFPPIMGLVSDMSNQATSLVVLVLGTVYLMMIALSKKMQ